MLKLSKRKIQVFDVSHTREYDMIKRSIFGGIVTCNVRYAEAKDDLVLEQLDINSAYIFIMRHCKLPIGDYCIVPPDSENWENIDPEGYFGYFLEINCNFPTHLHDYLDQFVPLVERKKPPGAATERLVSDFSDKKNYVLTLQHFQLILKLGVQITHIWQVLRYKQENYMAAYIDIVTKWRTESTNKFSNSLFKNMLCAIFGKTIERTDNRKCVEIVTDEKRMQKVIRKGTFLDRHIYKYSDFSMAVVELSKGVVFMDRPIIIGAFILNITKVYMYNFWYNVIKVNFNCASLASTDTDSMLFTFKSKNPNSIFKRLAHHFDFSNLDKTHELYSTENKGVLGKFKMETQGKKVLALCCVKSKVYSLLFEDSCVKKLKGIQKDYVLNKLTFDDYVNCVKYSETRFALFRTIVSREHELYTVQQCKLALECTDHKRFTMPDRINTLAFGNYRILSM